MWIGATSVELDPICSKTGQSQTATFSPGLPVRHPYHDIVRHHCAVLVHAICRIVASAINTAVAARGQQQVLLQMQSCNYGEAHHSCR